jgi:hypothetical protein
VNEESKACSTKREKRNGYVFLMGKTKRNSLLGLVNAKKLSK